jgi:sensor histidine kinase YesM
MGKDSKIREYSWAIVISILGSTILTYVQCTACRTDGSRFFDFVLFSSLNWMLLWTINSELNDFLSRKISWVHAPIKRFIVGVLATIVFTALGVFLIMRCFEWLFDFKFERFSAVIIPSLTITFFISLFFHGRNFLFQWRQSAVDAERYQKESMAATYENLKSQVNPHFLFNSFNTLTNLVYEDQDKAAKFIKQLSEVYRYVLDTRDKEVVSLEDELKFLESYSYLQQIRFGDKLTIKNSIQGLASMVAPLALQMLIENAVKHNEVSEENPLHIELYQEGGYVVVKNNLQKRMQLGESSSGLGLDNIVKRYKFLTDKPVEIQQSTKHFTVKLPQILNP